MSKTASASEKPNLFEFFRAPKVFEQSSKIAVIFVSTVTIYPMQSQACLSYAEVQPRLAVSFER